MKLGPHTQRFLGGAVDAAVAVITANLNPTKEMNDDVWKKLMGEPASSSFVPAPLSAADQYTMKMFWAFTEIHSCIERLKDCETYVRKFPFARTRVTRASYLQFVVEGHLHEIYLLRERLAKLAKLVARQFKRDRNAQQIRKTMDALAKLVTNALSDFTNTRGVHVHQWRYSHKDIDRLQLISTLRKPKGSQFSRSLKPLERHANLESHARLRRQAADWNRVVSSVLEKFFGRFGPLVLAQDGSSYVIPENLQNLTSRSRPMR